jgi:anti-sigma B factor antagonist
MSKSIEISKDSKGTLITILESSLVGITVDELKVEAMKIIESGEKRIILNLAKTNYIDSSGIGKILFINKKLISNGGVLEINKITPTLLDFFETLAIDKIIPIQKK